MNTTHFALIFLAFSATGCAFDFAPLHGTGLNMADSGPNLGDGGPTLPDAYMDLPDSGVDAYVVAIPDGGADAGLGPTGLDARYAVPPESNPSCGIPSISCTISATNDGVCRPYSPTERRCELWATPPSDCDTTNSCPCSTGADCSDLEMCVSGQCRAFCIIGTECNGMPCTSIGDSRLGYCER